MKSRTVVMIALSVLCSSAFAQSPKPTPLGGEPLQWMAVSIHPTDPAKVNEVGSNDQPNGLSQRGLPLIALISQAYSFNIMTMREDEVEGLPGWAKSAKYDVEARVAPEDVAAFRKMSDMPMPEVMAAYVSRQYTGEMLMEQAMLTERFHLKVHWETGERSVYEMTVAKGGPRLIAAADASHGSLSFSSGQINGKGIPLVFFANILAMPAERKVVDNTRLTGVYDLDLHFSPSNLNASSETNTDPGLFTALQEQLGLKLQPAKMTIPILVVNHIDPPTDN